GSARHGAGHGLSRVQSRPNSGERWVQPLRERLDPWNGGPTDGGYGSVRHPGTQLARIKKLSVGATVITGKEVGVVDLNGLIHERLLKGKPPVAGLLGAEILSRNHGV